MREWFVASRTQNSAQNLHSAGFAFRQVVFGRNKHSHFILVTGFIAAEDDTGLLGRIRTLLDVLPPRTSRVRNSLIPFVEVLEDRYPELVVYWSVGRV